MTGDIGIDDLTEDWAAVKRLPDQTGLPRAVWITENQGYPHDVRVKVSLGFAAATGCSRVDGTLPEPGAQLNTTV
jgi:hypothetical protein